MSPLIIFYMLYCKRKLNKRTKYSIILQDTKGVCSMKKFEYGGNKKVEGVVIHSLVGSTSGSNNTQTLTNIISQSTIKPAIQSSNQSQKVSE